MRLTKLFEAGINADKIGILQLQQELLEILPDDIDVAIETYHDEWRLKCTTDGYKGSVVATMATKITKSFGYYVVAMLLKDKLKQLGFINKSHSRYYLGRHDGREYTGVLCLSTAVEEPPFKIIARHQAKNTTSIYSIATIYSAKGLDRALRYLDTFDLSVLDSHDPSSAIKIAQQFE